MKRYEKLDGSPLDVDHTGGVSLATRWGNTAVVMPSDLAAAGLVREIDEVTLTLPREAVEALWEKVALHSVHPALFEAVAVHPALFEAVDAVVEA